MFDISNPTDLTALNVEVNTDPLSMGYAAVVEQTNNLLRLLNDPDNNVGGETVEQELTAEVLLDVIDTDDFASQQVDQGERDWLRMVFDFSNQGRSIEKYRAKIKGIFLANSATNQAIDALLRPLSRAEVLFGSGTILTRNDWIAARDV